MSNEILSATEAVKELYKTALLARERSYSPYSGFKVGAAFRTADGKVYSGCNVENSSFGGTICAERVAIHKGVSEQGPLEITEMMIVTDATPPWPPCGICRQVMAEFGMDITVYTSNTKGSMETFTFAELFPLAFTPVTFQKTDGKS